MEMSLEDIIASKEKQNSVRISHSTSSMGIRGSKGNRNMRYQSTLPYSEKKSNGLAKKVLYDAAIKFLLSNNLAGSIIGSGGSAIKSLIEVSGANVHVSGAGDVYPGSPNRVVYITGTERAVSLAQSLLWEMIGQQSAETEKAWDPAVAKASPGEYDNVEVAACVAIPAASAGLIIGRGGATIRALSDKSGAAVTLNDKDEIENEQTQERVLTIAGTVSSCMECTALVLSKLMEESDGCVYEHNGTRYPRITASAGRSTAGRRRQANVTDIDRAGHRNIVDEMRAVGTLPAKRKVSLYHTGVGGSSRKGGGGVHDTIPSSDSFAVSTNTTIELAVPDSMVGAVLGVQGVTLGEIISLSGADVKLSKRGEFIEGTTNRLVTIVGTPMCARTAQTLVLHKIKQSLQLQE